MDGFVIAGKAFAVYEELRVLAERNKGITVAELLKKQRLERIHNAEAQQFGVSVEELKGKLHGGK